MPKGRIYRYICLCVGSFYIPMSMGRIYRYRCPCVGSAEYEKEWSSEFLAKPHFNHSIFQHVCENLCCSKQSEECGIAARSGSGRPDKFVKKSPNSPKPTEINWAKINTKLMCEKVAHKLGIVYR
jgi:hypothetical protein